MLEIFASTGEAAYRQGKGAVVVSPLYRSGSDFPMHILALTEIKPEVHAEKRAVSCYFETHQKFVRRLLRASGQDGLYIAPADMEGARTWNRKDSGER